MLRGDCLLLILLSDTLQPYCSVGNEHFITQVECMVEC